MSKGRAYPDKTGKSASIQEACDLCGLPLRARRIEASFADGRRAFCCTGCRQVFTILLQASGSADPAVFRRTDLFRKCQENQIIPRTLEDFRENDLPSAVAPANSAPPSERLMLALRIENMWCPACAWLIETALGRTPGISAAACHFITDQLRVHYDPVATDPARIVAAIRTFGYRAVPAGEGRNQDQDHRRREWMRFGISTFLSMNVMMLSYALYFGFFTELSAESVASLSWPMAVMAALVMGYGGLPIFLRAGRGFTQAAFSMEALITVGALSAFGFSMVHLLSGSIHLYFDTACMLVTIVLLGKLLERRAKDRVLEGLESFLSIRPAKVRIIQDAFPDGRFVAAEQLAAGDLFRVDENEIVAADGILVSGGGSSEESSITGEPLPVPKKPGDPVRSGSRVRHGTFTICAERVGAESTLGQMMAVVDKTLAGKSPDTDRTAKIMQWFVPAILVLAAATGIALWMSGAGPHEALLRALTVTVISCPCALGIAVPLARAAGVALAAEKGMLIRSFSAFEQAAAIDTIVLDKTGTVTRGVWRLLDIALFEGCTREKALGLACGLEQGGAHAIALELLDAARSLHIRPERVSGIQAQDNGVSGIWEGVPARIGSLGFLSAEFAGRPMLENVLSGQASRSFVYLGIDGKPAAIFIFGDEVRDGADQAVAALQQSGYQLALVSGDGAETTRSIGRQLGITETYGGQLPADKARIVSGLQRRGRRVAVVGDGINDAPALAMADLSLAVFSGGNLAKEVADATLMRAEPMQIPEFMRFSRAVHRKIRQNLLCAFLYNVISISFAISGLLSPLVAVCAMLLSSLSVIGNTYLLVRKNP